MQLNGRFREAVPPNRNSILILTQCTLFLVQPRKKKPHMCAARVSQSPIPVRLVAQFSLIQLTCNQRVYPTATVPILLKRLRLHRT